MGGRRRRGGERDLKKGGRPNLTALEKRGRERENSVTPKLKSRASLKIRCNNLRQRSNTDGEKIS